MCNFSDPMSPPFWRPWGWSHPANPSRCSANTGVRTESVAVISALLIMQCARILIPESVPFSTWRAATPRAHCIIIPALIQRNAVPPTPRECEFAHFLFIFVFFFDSQMSHQKSREEENRDIDRFLYWTIKLCLFPINYKRLD